MLAPGRDSPTAAGLVDVAPGEPLETLDTHAETPATEADAGAFIERAKTLLAPAETGTEFQKNYFLALQQSPDVVLLHSEIMKLLR